MKVFISFDMEGVAGILDWSQCRPPGQPYEEGRRLLLSEVNAAIDGAVAAGATEIICNDSHGTMNNVEMQTADMAEVASWVRGAERTGVRTVRADGEDPLAVYRSFVAVTYITRVAEGRLRG